MCKRTLTSHQTMQIKGKYDRLGHVICDTPEKFAELFQDCDDVDSAIQQWTKCQGLVSALVKEKVFKHDDPTEDELIPIIEQVLKSRRDLPHVQLVWDEFLSGEDDKRANWGTDK